ncbi:hemolysin family protein [Paenibacillus sp. CMAA1364]
MRLDPLPSELNILIIFVLIMLNGFFVSAEYAMVKARSSRMDGLVADGRKGAILARNITNNLDSYLLACQLGITISSLGLGWIGAPAIARWLHPLFSVFGFGETLVYGISFTLSFVIITILHSVLGEIAPKTFALRKADVVTLISAGPITLFYKIMSPFIWVLHSLANLILRVLHITSETELGTAHTEEEIRILMQESSKSGLINNTELALVDNIFGFAETTAREIMIPRTEMICLYNHVPREENLEIAYDAMRTRYPYCDGDKDNIIGFIHIKDLIRANDIEYPSIIRPIITVPESIHISTLLKLMQRGKSQIAILIDEYGGTSGLVTMEDIMEEIVGEIQDEFDEERPVIEKINDDEFSIDGLMLIDEINERFELDMDTADYDTIGGWLYSRLDTIPPQKGQSVEFDDHIYIVEETDNKRISRILLHRMAFQTKYEGA